MVSGNLRILFLVMAMLAFATPQGFAADAEVTDIRVGKQGLSTRIVIDLDRPIAAKVFTLAGPARLVIDLPEVGWRLPAAPVACQRGCACQIAVWAVSAW